MASRQGKVKMGGQTGQRKNETEPGRSGEVFFILRFPASFQTDNTPTLASVQPLGR